MNDLVDRGWLCFAAEQVVADWARIAFDVARDRVTDPEEQRAWLQCEGTWFVGVDTLPNDAAGNVDGSGPLRGEAFAFASEIYGHLPLHRGQVSVIYPGYPRPRQGESEPAFRYRRDRDAAHVDGLLAEGVKKRRYLIERHAYILGLPLTSCSPGASPMVVWEGSHHIMRRCFAEALQDVPEADWHKVDLTDHYQAARREVFETCKRLEIHAEPGESYLVHRHALHGVAPWAETADAPEDGRMIVYFRPEQPKGSRAWLEAP